MIKETKQFKRRMERREETPKTLFLRALFWKNKYAVKQLHVLDEDWDYLIVLDACRYDYFKSYNTIPGKLEKRFSAGTHTVEWLKENFNRNCSDVVYVSANPQVSAPKLEQWTGEASPFLHLENVWYDAWDEKNATVLPKQVNKASLRLAESYPGKRMIVHYMQPHMPFIGNPRIKLTKEQIRVLYSPDWGTMLGDTITLDVLRDAYAANLVEVLKYAEKLVKKLGGKTVVTSDHGESFGENGIYGHVPAMYTPSLIEVPWLEVENL
ncbi:MAG: hypothetical protein KAW41_00520 [Candidatus Diapherotrites archaeon]|nr:hypothetical protein [Candidatus Diapherotrites archaeon]